MIHIVTAENRRFYHRALMQMHRQRKEVFVDELGWRLEASSGLEFDAYDSPEAIYLIEAIGPDGPVTGSARLLPTTAAHLMSEVFAHLCDEVPPRGAHVWEATRFCPAPSMPKGEPRRALLGRLIAAIIETALLFGIDEVSFVASAALGPLARRAGWETRALGPSQRSGRERLTAMAARIDAEGLRRVRARYSITGPIARYLPGDMAQAA